MNTPSPLVPQGSLQHSKGKSNVRIAILTILAIHAVLLGGLLIQGCKRDSKTSDSGTPTNNTDVGFAPLTTNAPEMAVSNPPPAIPTPQITMSPATSAAMETPSVATKEYVVAKGDILASIARKYGVTVKEIEAANSGLVPTKLRIGQKIQVPVSSGSTHPVAASGEIASGGDTAAYLVKPGDSLTKIARAHGTTVQTIRKLNNLKTDQIRVGQKLKLPAGKGTAMDSASAPITGTNYVTPLPRASAR